MTTIAPPTTLATSRRRLLQHVAGGIAGTALPLGAWAQGAPSPPVRVIAGAPPGGPSDFMGRLFADHVGPAIGQTFLVENRPGAAGLIAGEAAVKAGAENPALFASGQSTITNAPFLYSKMPFDPQRDLQPVSMLGAGAFAMASHPSLPVNNAQEFIAYARANPGKISFGSGGNGSSSHFVTEAFASAAGIKLLHVPYKGDGQAVNDLIGGQIQLMVTAPNVVVPHAQNGRLKLLGVTTLERAPSMPQVPTLHESGVRDFEYLGWIILFTHAAVPAAQIERWNAAWQKARQIDTVRQRLRSLAMEAPERLSTPQALRTFLALERERVAKVVRDAGIKPE